MPSYHSIYENPCKLQKIFLISVFGLNNTFPVKFKIRILDLMLLPKNSVSFEGLYYNDNCVNPKSDPRDVFTIGINQQSILFQTLIRRTMLLYSTHCC